MVSNTYCTMPWSHLHVAVDGQIQLCCISQRVGLLSKNTLEDVWNGDTLKRVRKQMLNNEKPPECSKCFYREDVLKTASLRTHITEEFGKYLDPIKDTQPDGSLQDMKLLYVDYRFNNLCNFKCRICSPTFSSAIGSELVTAHKLKNVKIISEYGPNLYEEIKKQYPHVKKIYFAGGEPVMQREHFEVLKDLIALGRASDITLLYSTNGSKFKTGLGNMFEYWKHFKKVEINFSIDGYRKPAEYWRSGTDWEDVESNIRQTLTIPNIVSHIHSVVGWPNVFNWIEFIRYALDTKLLKNLINGTNVSILDKPSIYSFDFIPEFKKNAIHTALSELKEYLLKYINDTNYNIGEGLELIDCIDMLINSLYIEATPNNEISKKLLKQQFIEKNTVLDKWRGEDFFTAFPEHNDMKTYLGITE